MRYPLIVLAAAASAAAVACLERDNATSPNTGPLAAAVAIPCIGEDTADVPYFEKRVFLESQGWWGERRTSGSVPKYGDAEHIHVGLCFPLKQMVAGSLKVVVKVMGHNLPVGSTILTTGLHDPNDNLHHINLASSTWNRRVLAADNGDITLRDTLLINTRDMPDGLREFRNLTKVVRPPEAGQSVGAEIHASSGWCWQVKNTNNTPMNSGLCDQNSGFTTQARGWYDCFEYKNADVRNWSDGATLTGYPFAGIARNTDYKLKITGRDGAGDNLLLTGWEVRLDPDFHHDTLGTLITSGTSSAVQTITIPGAKLTGPRTHKLVIIARANQKCTTPAMPGSGITPQDGEVSGVLAVPLKVN